MPPPDVELRAIFTEAGCTGSLYAVDPAAGTEVSLDPHRPAVAASVIKVLIALRAEIDLAEGRLDPRRPVLLAADGRTPGPVGFSLYADDVTTSTRDLVSATLTISDNVAADALLGLVGIDRCHELAADLGLTDTVVVSDLATMITSIARHAGHPDWSSLDAARAEADAEQAAALEARIRTAPALDAGRATRTTARDMGRLLAAVWSDTAGPPAACDRLRRHLSAQLTHHRIARGFTPPTQVAAKSGGLLGVVRNEIATVTRPGRAPVHVAIFTEAAGGASGRRVDDVFGVVAAAAVDRLG